MGFQFVLRIGTDGLGPSMYKAKASDHKNTWSRKSSFALTAHLLCYKVLNYKLVTLSSLIAGE